jgi:hypothetical protein
MRDTTARSPDESLDQVTARLRDRPEPLLWDLEQLAAALNVSERSAKRFAVDGTLPPGAVVHVGRRRLFSRAIIEKWVASGCPVVRRR